MWRIKNSTNLQTGGENLDTVHSNYFLVNHHPLFFILTYLQGENIYNALLKAGTEGGIAIRIAENKPSEDSPDEDTVGLQKAGAADVHILDFDKLMGGGVLHTKLWIVDRKHVFIGSPNMDWRSLTQVNLDWFWSYFRETVTA